MALQFIAWMEIDYGGPWNIFRAGETHFYTLCQQVKLQNMDYQEFILTANTLFTVPLHSEKITVWCRFMATFIIPPPSLSFQQDKPYGFCYLYHQSEEVLLRNRCSPVSTSSVCEWYKFEPFYVI